MPDEHATEKETKLFTDLFVSFVKVFRLSNVTDYIFKCHPNDECVVSLKCESFSFHTKEDLFSKTLEVFSIYRICRQRNKYEEVKEKKKKEKRLRSRAAHDQ